MRLSMHSSVGAAWCRTILLPLTALALGSGCVISKEIGDETGGTSETDGTGGTGGTSETDGEVTTQGPTGTSASTGDPTETTGDPTETTGGAGACDPSPDFQCAGPIDCSGGGCGGPFSQFDELGCLRPSCGGPEDCGPGQACFTPLDFGGCASSGIFCIDEGGACLCSGDPDCNGSYCLPEDEVPSGDECWGQPDQAACSDAGCNHFETVTVITDTCACIPDQPACVLFLDGIGGADAPDYFWHEDTLTVALFGSSWSDLPEGWHACTEPGSPVACDCYEPFTDPECP